MSSSYTAVCPLIMSLKQITRNLVTRQHKCIVSQFWRSEVLKSRCRQGCSPSGGSGRESMSFHVLVQRPPAFLGLWPPSIFKANSITSFSLGLCILPHTTFPESDTSACYSPLVMTLDPSRQSKIISYLQNP